MAATWEYHYEPVGPGIARRFLSDWEDRFRRLGEEGWEHSGTIMADEGEFIVFKRPVVPEG